MTPLVASALGTDTNYATIGLTLHLMLTAVLLGPLLDIFRFGLRGGRVLLAWQPPWGLYRIALRKAGRRLPLDAIVIVMIAYATLVLGDGVPIPNGIPTQWQVHLLFVLLFLASLMPPLYIISERGVVILRPHAPWRRELSPWCFSWEEVEAAHMSAHGIAVRLRSLGRGLPQPVRILATEKPDELLATVLRIRPSLAEPEDSPALPPVLGPPPSDP